MTQPTTTTSTAEATLRKVLLINTELSTVTGLAGLVFGGPVAEMLGVDQVWLIRLLGAGLLAFAAGVFFVARSPRSALAKVSREISVADIGWVLGTIVVIALGWLSTTGALVMAVIGVLVGALGLLQMKSRSAMLRGA